jgi:hypothetical protein
MTATDQAATIRPAVVPMPVDLVAARVEPGTPIHGARPRKSAPRAPPAI